MAINPSSHQEGSACGSGALRSCTHLLGNWSVVLLLALSEKLSHKLLTLQDEERWIILFYF